MAEKESLKSVSPGLDRWLGKIKAQAEKRQLPQTAKDLLLTTFVTGYSAAVKDATAAVNTSESPQECLRKLAGMEINSLTALISQVVGTPEALANVLADSEDDDIDMEGAPEIQFAMPHNGSVN